VSARSDPRTLPAGRTLVLAAGAVAAFALAVAATRPWSMVFWPTTGYAALLVALAASALVAVLAVRARRDQPSAPGPLLRGLVCFAVAAALPWFVWIQPFKALWLLMYAGVCAGVFAGLWWAAPTITRLAPPRLCRIAALTVFNLCLAVLGAELALRLLAAVHPSPILAAGATPSAVFAQYRKAPAALHLGLRCDERGFNDRLVRAPGTRLVACVGDSFSFGLVPRLWHYTCLAEQQLERVEIYNAGVIAAGPAEYLRLLSEDLLPLGPDAIVVALFVGNDLEEAARFEPGWSGLAQVFDREHLRLWTVPRRLARLAAERARPDEAGPIGAIQGEDAGELPADTDALLQRFPWLADPSLERGTMAEATFVEVERRRAAFACAPGSEDAYPTLFRALDALRAAAGTTPLAFVLIPDEFQVEDAVWAAVGAPDLVRDLPQQRIRAWLEARGLACLDLLPVFRAVPPLADGDRHLYHRRDTHWNRRGNEVAGAALAEFLRGWLPD
jgi:hypothetical protein